MPDKKIFKKVAVPEELKREIAITAGSEGRYEYEILQDAWRLYKAVAVGKSPHSKNTKSVSVVDVISSH